jgi:uncharacterized Tic20 family protein
MADDDSTDKESQDDAANPEAEGGPPPLASEGADAEPEKKSVADEMEESLPQALKGGEGTVGLGQGSLSEKDERTFAMLAHILGIAVLVGPLVIWALKKDESPFVDDQGRESIAFQLLMLIAFVVVGVIGAIPVVGCAAVVLWPAVGLTNIIMVVMAGLKANEGVPYRYPFALRVL